MCQEDERTESWDGNENVTEIRNKFTALYKYLNKYISQVTNQTLTQFYINQQLSKILACMVSTLSTSKTKNFKIYINFG